MTDTVHATIDYGSGVAEFWGKFDRGDAEQVFMHHTNQCFGIRKSIMGFQLLSAEAAPLPEPWAKLDGAATVLKHSGDTIVWDAVGDKIKTEWD